MTPDRPDGSIVDNQLRCPAAYHKLLGKIVEGNLIEVACSDCVRAIRNGGETVTQVLHRFNILGELVETQIVRPH